MLPQMTVIEPRAGMDLAKDRSSYLKGYPVADLPSGEVNGSIPEIDRATRS
jgi:hypothetical protein